MTNKTLLEARTTEGGAAEYRRSLNAAVRSAWLRVATPDDFLWSVGAAIDRGLRNAWMLGMAEGGIGPGEMTPEETAEMKRFIITDRMLMGGWMTRLYALPSKAEGGKLRQYISGVTMRVNTWWACYTKAQAMAAGNRKMKFTRFKSTKKPCRTCAGLQDRVYRNSTWLANDAIPRPGAPFVCSGYLCGHRLVQTEDRITPGKFPRRLLTR